MPFGLFSLKLHLVFLLSANKLFGSFEFLALFWSIFIINLCRRYPCDFRKKGPRPKWTKYKHVSDKSKKYLSVGNSGALSAVGVCVFAPTHTRLCKGLNHSPNDRFSRPFSWTGRQHCPMSEKQNHKNERHLRLVAYIFTKFSQNVCLINTHTLIY